MASAESSGINPWRVLGWLVDLLIVALIGIVCSLNVRVSDIELRNARRDGDQFTLHQAIELEARITKRDQTTRDSFLAEVRQINTRLDRLPETFPTPDVERRLSGLETRLHNIETSTR